MGGGRAEQLSVDERMDLLTSRCFARLPLAGEKLRLVSESWLKILQGRLK